MKCKFPPGVLLTFIKEGIVNYINTTFPNFYIESISHKHNRNEVELNNDVELVFDSNGVFFCTLTIKKIFFCSVII